MVLVLAANVEASCKSRLPRVVTSLGTIIFTVFHAPTTLSFPKPMSLNRSLFPRLISPRVVLLKFEPSNAHSQDASAAVVLNASTRDVNNVALPEMAVVSVPTAVFQAAGKAT